MAVKSIIDIDVNDKSFKQFVALFNTYQKQLQQTPLAWQQIARGQQQGLKSFKELVAEQAKSIQQAKMIALAEKEANRLLRTRADMWQDMRRSTASVLGNVREIGSSMLRWTGIVGTISGLIGAGGLFGVSRLAEGVATGRRGSLGVGASYGQNSAFSNAFGRLVDPGSFLGGVEGSLTDVTKRVSLYQAGLSEGQLGGGSAAVGSRLINQIKKLADQTPDALLGNVFQARGLGQFMSEDDFRRIKRTSGAEIGELQRKFGARSAAYDLSDKDQKAYSDFTQALDDAGRKIELVFVKGLAPLIPGLEKVSTSIVKVIEDFTKAVPPDWGEKAGKGIEDFAKYIGSDDFRSAVKTFAEGVVWIAKKFAAIGGVVLNHTNTVDKSDPAFAGAYGQVPESGGQAKANRILNGIFGVRVKRGAGEIDPGLQGLASAIDQRIAGIKQFTAFNDDFHKGRNSAHNDNRAFDLTVADPSKSAEIADSIRRLLTDKGIKGTVIDEYKNPSPGSTGGHIHVQTDVRVMNAAGSNVIVQTNQAAAGAAQ